jgi:2-C-methyl-D-erythritol 4-phosphate cytidylyltransferase
MPDAARCLALVPCAGVGTRAAQGGPKQYALLAGRSVVAHTLAALANCPALHATLVVLAPDDTEFERQVPAHHGERAWVARSGGATRAASVAAGLAALRAHGARVDAVGGLLALPLADTLKAADAEGRASATLSRDGKWLAQTPQMFRLGPLRRALHEAGPDVTDEASAIEALGLRPRLVPGELENLKVTWPGDFALAARLLETR